MRFNIVKSQLQSFVIRVISTVFRCRRRCRQVIIRARDSFQPGHIPVNRIDAAGSWRVCARSERARAGALLGERRRSVLTQFGVSKQP